jgi:hypothetical protein
MQPSRRGLTVGHRKKPTASQPRIRPDPGLIQGLIAIISCVVTVLRRT